MSRRLLWMVLIGIGLAMILLIARHDRGTIAGLAADDFGSLVYYLALIVLIGSGVLVMFRERFSQALEAALFWVVVGFVLVLAYTYRADLRMVGDRVLAELMRWCGAGARRPAPTAGCCWSGGAPATSRWRPR
jgi:aspartyl protease family protein